MSGSIGGDRIKRTQVQPTVDKYEKEVLKGFPGYQKYEITGSYNVGTKSDHGDIDLCVWVNGGDIKAVKKNFKKYLESLPEDITPAFRWGRKEGEKAQLYGSIVTCQTPIFGEEDKFVQVDNIIVLTRQELDFQKTFLNLNAQLQTLVTGLVKVLDKGKKEKAFKQLGIDGLPDLESNQEFEFVVSTQALSLRKVTLSDEMKQTKREEIWRTFDWNLVEDLLNISLDGKYDPKLSYEELMDITADVYKNDERVRRRICGIIKSMINVGPGEIGTPKGDGKIAGIKLAFQKLNVSEGLIHIKDYIMERLK